LIKGSNIGRSPGRRSLIERIDVCPGSERGRCEVYIVSALAHILAFTQQKTTAAAEGNDGTFLTVAKAPNHREPDPLAVAV